MDVADRYYDGLIARFGEIVDTPQLWPELDQIRAGYRRSFYIALSIYYSVEVDSVIIVRVLGHQNTQTVLPGD